MRNKIKKNIKNSIKKSYCIDLNSFNLIAFYCNIIPPFSNHLRIVGLNKII